MKFEIVTIFPDFFRGPLDYGIVRRARESGVMDIAVHDLRAFTRDRHRTVDDRPFGGGEGMVLKPEPIFECVESLRVKPQQDRKALLLFATQEPLSVADMGRAIRETAREAKDSAKESGTEPDQEIQI